MSMAEADELDRMRAAFRLMSDLRSAEEEADRAGWIEADDVEKEMGIYDWRNWSTPRSIYHEKEDFMRDLFGISSADENAEAYWEDVERGDHMEW